MNFLIIKLIFLFITYPFQDSLVVVITVDSMSLVIKGSSLVVMEVSIVTTEEENFVDNNSNSCFAKENFTTSLVIVINLIVDEPFKDFAS